MSRIAIGVLAAALLLPAVAQADESKLCIPRGFGVPGAGGPPDWTLDAPNDDARARYNTPFDARWRGSSGHATNIGTASAPLDFRALYSGTDAGTKTVFMSWKINVGATAGRRDFFLGVRDASAPNQENTARLIHFHIEPTADANGGFAKCTQTEQQCNTALKAWYQVLVFKRKCGIDEGNAACDCDWSESPVRRVRQFEPATDAEENEDWLDDARYWTDTSGSQVLWSVGVRAPVAAPGTAFAPTLEYLTDTTRIWYQASLDTLNIESGYSQWPRLAQNSICSPEPNTLGSTVYELPLYYSSTPADNVTELNFGPIQFIDDGYNPGFSPLSELPEGCGGITISPNTVQVRDHNGNLGNGITGNYDVGGTAVRHVNPFQVQVQNLGATGSPSIRARFRIANWGTQNMNALYQTAIWEDVFDNFPEPDPDTNLTPAVTVPPGSTQTLILDGWRLTDAQMRDFGYLGGTQTKDRHQCILAEIEAASGNADFVTRSAYTNMIVGSLSTFSKTAVVDSGSSDFAFRDVYMFVMTKNMPATVDAGVTGRSIVQANAYRVAQEIRAQYEEDPIVIDLKAVNGRRPDEMMSIAYRLEYFSRRQQCGGEGSGSGTGSGSGRECNWPELIQDLVEWMPADIAARVLPTAEIYSYLDTGSRVRRGSRVKRSVEPMTSFGFHLYHDGGLEGFRQVLDGADVLGPNLYRVRLGADGRTVVQARSQAIDTGERPIKPDPQWDPVRDGCDDYCPPTRGGFVGLIALWGLTILGVRRLLRRRKSSI